MGKFNKGVAAMKMKTALRTILVVTVVSIATVLSAIPVAAWPVATGP
ncbi:hypothetical protein DGWBC_0083 [Dehalogenimonas sp. WBC-2]|nr:hypothetical protein DGWBC_0083 [Dehalogenimonas sp. WBC-2]